MHSRRVNSSGTSAKPIAAELQTKRREMRSRAQEGVRWFNSRGTLRLRLFWKSGPGSQCSMPEAVPAHSSYLLYRGPSEGAAACARGASSPSRIRKPSRKLRRPDSPVHEHYAATKSDEGRVFGGTKRKAWLPWAMYSAIHRDRPVKSANTAKLFDVLPRH